MLPLRLTDSRAFDSAQAMRPVFMLHHADHLDAAFCQAHKARIMAGHVHGGFPCKASKCFKQPLSAVP